MSKKKNIKQMILLAIESYELIGCLDKRDEAYNQGLKDAKKAVKRIIK